MELYDHINNIYRAIDYDKHNLDVVVLSGQAFRLECYNGEGPWKGSRPICMSGPCLSPTPQVEGLGYEDADLIKCRIHGCATLKILDGWFGGSGYQMAARQGFHIVEYDIRDAEPLFCAWQVLFKREKARPIRYLHPVTHEEEAADAAIERVRHRERERSCPLPSSPPSSHLRLNLPAYPQPTPLGSVTNSLKSLQYLAEGTEQRRVISKGIFTWEQTAEASLQFTAEASWYMRLFTGSKTTPECSTSTGPTAVPKRPRKWPMPPKVPT